MSILLDGEITACEANDNLNWNGKWYFLKEKKAYLNFNYQRVSECIPIELIDYVSFKDPASLAQENSLSLRKIRKDRLRSRGRSGRIMKNTTINAGNISNHNLTNISTVGGITGIDGNVANDSIGTDNQPKPDNTDFIKKVVFDIPTISSNISSINKSTADNVNNNIPRSLVQDTLQNIVEDPLLQEEEEEGEDKDGDIIHHHDEDSEDEDDGNSEQEGEEQDGIQRQHDGVQQPYDPVVNNGRDNQLSSLETEGSTINSSQVDQNDSSTNVPSENNNNNNNKDRNSINSKGDAYVTIERTNPLFGLWEGSFILKNKLSAPEQNIPETFFFHSLYTHPSISSHNKNNISHNLPLELQDLPVDPQFYGTVLGFLPSSVTNNITNTPLVINNSIATSGSSTATTTSQESRSMDGSSSLLSPTTTTTTTVIPDTDPSITITSTAIESTPSISPANSITATTTTTTTNNNNNMASSVVTGFGRNCFGRFALLGVYDANTGAFRCERKYLTSKLPSKRGRKPSGGALLSHLIMPTGSSSNSSSSSSAPLSTRSSHALPSTSAITTTTDSLSPSLVMGILTTTATSSSGGAHHHPSSSTSTSKKSNWEGSGQKKEEDLDDNNIPTKRLRKSSISKSSKSYSYSFDGSGSIEDTVGSSSTSMGARRSRGDGSNEDNVGFRGAIVDPITGEIYEGSWEDGQRHGTGVCVYPEGLTYQGSWVKGKESGVGQLLYNDRQLIYSGDWLDGRMHGHGTYYFPNGDEYTGEWKEGMRHGTGVYKLSDGSRYNGDWKENKRNGKGVFVWSDGSTYEGDWDDNMRHGRGELKLVSGFRYDGNWIKNCMEGRGTSVFPDGQEYQGMFRWGKRDGRGSVKFAEGAVYEGRFKDDRIDGQGTLQITKTVPGAEEGEKLIPILIRADMRRIHYRAGFGDDLLR